MQEEIRARALEHYKKKYPNKKEYPDYAAIDVFWNDYLNNRELYA